MRIHEILGVKPGEHFSFDYPNRPYKDCYISDIGEVISNDGQTHKIGRHALYWLIEHPEGIVHAPGIRMSRKETGIVKAFDAKRVWFESFPPGVRLFDWNDDFIVQLSDKFFPSFSTVEKSGSYKVKGEYFVEMK